MNSTVVFRTVVSGSPLKKVPDLIADHAYNHGLFGRNMWFRNLQIYRLPANWDMTSERLEECLSSHAFEPGTSMDLQSCGWASPRDNGALVHEVNRQMLIMFSTEKKLLPSSIVNQVAKEKSLQMEEEQGYKPGRKQMKEIK